MHHPLGFALFFGAVSGLPYGVLIFLLLQLPRSKRHLLLLTVLMTGLWAAEYYHYNHLPFEKRNSFGDMFAPLILGTLLFSIFMGTVTRFIVLSKKQSANIPFVKRIRLTVYGFLFLLLIPFSFTLGTSKLSEWNNRPPSESCNSLTAPVLMDGIAMNIPKLDFFHLAIGTGNEKSSLDEIRKNNVYFFGNKGLRSYCERYDDGKKPVIANAMSVNFGNIPRSLYDPKYKAFCNTANDEQKTLYCMHEKPISRLSLNFFVQGKYNASRMYAIDRTLLDSYANPTPETQDLFSNLKPQKVGDAYYWTLQYPQVSESKSVHVYCKNSPGHVFTLDCQTLYAIKGNLLVHYFFQADQESFPEEARKSYDLSKRVVTNLISND